MLYQIVIITGLVIIAVNLVLNLRSLQRPQKNSKITEPTPFVSILIPARNEQGNIEACIQSLRQQDYPYFEVLVLDDSSTDNTAGLVADIAAEDKRVRLFHGDPLPAGWAGKPFACHQLSQHAAGSWMLFVDADTTHAPHMLRSTMAIALDLNPSLLSGFPRQVAHSIPQKIAIPVLYFVILSWLPLWWLQRSKKRRPSLAIGQFLLFQTDEYHRIGGHRAVHSRILEDVWLGYEIHRHRGKHVAIDLSSAVSCNMYSNLGAMWEGFVKWMHSVASLSPVAMIAMMAAGYFFYLAPFYWLRNELFIVSAPTAWRYIVFGQVAIIIGLRWLLDNRFKEPLISSLLHPIGFTYLFTAVLYGCFQVIMSKGVQWKERFYGADTGVE